MIKDGKGRIIFCPECYASGWVRYTEVPDEYTCQNNEEHHGFTSVGFKETPGRSLKVVATPGIRPKTS